MYHFYSAANIPEIQDKRMSFEEVIKNLAPKKKIQNISKKSLFLNELKSPSTATI